MGKYNTEIDLGSLKLNFDQFKENIRLRFVKCGSHCRLNSMVL